MIYYNKYRTAVESHPVFFPYKKMKLFQLTAYTMQTCQKTAYPFYYNIFFNEKQLDIFYKIFK